MKAKAMDGSNRGACERAKQSHMFGAMCLWRRSFEKLLHITTDLLHMCVLAQACTCCGRVSVHFPLPAASNGARTRNECLTYTRSEHDKLPGDSRTRRTRWQRAADKCRIVPTDAPLFEVVVVLIVIGESHSKQVVSESIKPPATLPQMFALLRLRQSIPRVPFAAIRFASSNGEPKDSVGRNTSALEKIRQFLKEPFVFRHERCHIDRIGVFGPIEHWPWNQSILLQD